MGGRRWIGSGSRFEADIGYSRAVVDGDWAFVSGTTGFEYAAGTIEDDVAVQCAKALDNIEAALAWSIARSDRTGPNGITMLKSLSRSAFRPIR